MPVIIINKINVIIVLENARKNQNNLTGGSWCENSWILVIFDENQRFIDGLMDNEWKSDTLLGSKFTGALHYYYYYYYYYRAVVCLWFDISML